MRHALKLRGYKKGRISQLISLTRPTSTASGVGAAAGPNPASGQSVGEVGDESEVVVENKEQVLQVLQEVAEEERLNEEVRGRPEILQDSQDAELQDPCSQNLAQKRRPQKNLRQDMQEGGPGSCGQTRHALAEAQQNHVGSLNEPMPWGNRPA